MQRYGIFILALMLFGTLLSFAWTEYTNVIVAKLVLLNSYPMCAAQIEEGAAAPLKEEVVDPILGEPVNMHCDTLACPAYDPRYCQMNAKTCPSETVAGEIKSSAKTECDCDQARTLAKAITYYIAKYDPMNLMINEKCHTEFDQAVEDAMRNGGSEWNVNFECSAPNKTFTFNSKKFDEMVAGTKSFAFAEAYSGSHPWFCYTLGKPSENQGKLKGIGDICTKNEECMSGHCNNNVCCNAEVCCPVPGIKGFPCNQGEKCNSEYTCEPVNAKNGERCDYDEECMSGNCRPGSATFANKYCCESGKDHCCATGADCLSNEECRNNVCVEKLFVPKNETNATTNGTAKPEGGLCPSIAVLLMSFGGLAILGSKLVGRS